MRIATRTSSIRAGLGAAVKAAAAALALAACGFHPAGGTPGGPDAGAGDAAPPPDAALDGTVARPFCDPADPAQRLCLTFAGGAVVDGSGGALPVTSANVGFAPGAVDEAVRVKADSVLHVAETAALDVTVALTMEAFVDVAAVPSPRAGIMDNNGQYGMWVSPQLRPYCTLPGSTVSGPTIALDTWTHVACVFDGATFALYVDGAFFGSVNRTAPVPTTGLDGVNVGQDATATGAADPLTGGLDEVRIWATARTAAEVAAAAARRAP